MARSAANRPPSPLRSLALPALGGVLVAALAIQLWRGVDLERSARAAELAQAIAVAEAILREAPHSAAAFASLPGGDLLTTGPAGIVPDAELGWLQPERSSLDDDPVVAYRLDRAARAEFASGDATLARAEFDELLAGPLLPAPRLQCLAAAAWQSHRAGDAARTAELAARADELLAALRPTDLARPQLARAVAAVLRLPRPTPPPWAATLVPYLPADTLAGLPPTNLTTAAEQRSRRRTALQQLDAAWRAQQAPTGRSVLFEHAGDLVWAQPSADHHQLRTLSHAAFLAALQRAGEAGQLPRWPWLVAADFGPTAEPVAGIPGLRALRPAAAAPAWSPWLWPAATAALLLAFAAAVAARLRATARESAALAAQADFLTNVTHELKTPLAAIRLLAEMLAEGRAAGREAEYHTMLVGETARLSTLIENVLDLGRAERGERPLVATRLDAAAVVRDTVAVLTPLATQQGLQITVDAPPLPFARGDQDAVAQALVAVLDNARKYATGPIEVAAREQPRTIEIAVRDHGPGVPAAERERIFERFVRGAAQQHGSVPGVGVGLYLARTLLRRGGGDLRCQAADPGPGALFLLTLPREDAA